MTDHLTKSSTKNSLFIENAGMVILWPFFTFLFEKLELLKGNSFVSQDAAIRASYILQYLVTGHQNFNEQGMAFNKFLCNLPHNTLLPPITALTEPEKELCHELLINAISRWEIIHNTSIEGLRESFLLRFGKLEWHDEHLTLHVEKKSFDILIDKLPWSISVIRLGWMKDPIDVYWR